ncbi:MurR/RpiR family transcriptional regulator [Treponema sp. HNW]|uniref:MurR/RpiR family transcriptional regulator n=1 Tax=Treponema sp. HNW TaxID=3116654 RepID=UPI003D0CA2C4
MTNIEIKIQNGFEQLSNAEKNAARYFLNNTNSIFDKPIAVLAKESNTTQAAWVRFCKSLGFKGLKDLKKSFFSQVQTAASEDTGESYTEYSDISGYKSVEEISSNVMQSGIRAVTDTVKLIDNEDMKRAAQIIMNAHCVKLFGISASALVAEDFYYKLLRIGKNACFCADSHMQLSYAANISNTDAAVIISHSGTTTEIVEMLHSIKKRRAASIAVTKFSKKNPLNRADIILHTSAPEIYKRSGAMSSRIAQLTVIDILFSTIAHQNYNHVRTHLEQSYQSCFKHKRKV